MSDHVVKAIRAGELSSASISFPLLRRIAGIDKDKWSELDRGRAVLSTTDQLDQYLYSYGLMISSQWQVLLDRVRLPSSTVALVDYGCGQGLATMLLLDRYREDLSGMVANVTLIEPSTVALERALHILTCYLPDVEIRAVNKQLDELDQDDFADSGTNVNMHLFSNILDVDGFDQYTLFSDMFQHAGRHVVLAVGNDRTLHGGSERLEILYELVHDKAHSHWLRLRHSELEYYSTDRGQAAIYFYIDLDVNGSF